MFKCYKRMNIYGSNYLWSDVNIILCHSTVGVTLMVQCTNFCRAVQGVQWVWCLERFLRFFFLSHKQVLQF